MPPSAKPARPRKRKATPAAQPAERASEGTRADAKRRAHVSELERFRTLLDQASDAVFLLDVPSGRIADANKTAHRLLGFAGRELARLPASQVLPQIGDQLSSLAAQHGLPIPMALRARDGSDIPVEAAINLVDFDGQKRGLVIARRIASRSEAEQAADQTLQRFRAVFEGAAIGMAVASTDGRIQQINGVLEQLLGLSSVQLRGRQFAELIEPGELEERGPKFASMLKVPSGEHLSEELRLVRADGKKVSVICSVSLVRDAHGALDYLLIAVQDISDRKRADDALRFVTVASAALSSSLEIKDVVEAAGALAVPDLGEFCAIYVCQPSGALERVLLKVVDERGQQLADALQSQYPAVLAGELGAAAALRTAAIRVLNLDGPEPFAAAAGPAERLALWRSLELRAAMVAPLITAGRQRGALVVGSRSPHRYDELDREVAHEFASRLAVALDNARLYREAQEANRLKDEFLAIVSHELRTPLTSILGWAWLMNSPALDRAALMRGASVIRRSGQVLSQIIDDLLDVSRIIAGKMEMVPLPTDLSQVVETALEAVRPQAQEKGIDLQLHREPGLPSVRGDAKRLHQVVWNLVVNAVKFTPSGGRVEVALTRAGAMAQLSVKDTGRGILPEFLPYVFERFRQADSSTTRAFGGLGLGLTIVHSLVSMHGGNVKANSAGEGAGSTFVVQLPLASELPAGVRQLPQRRTRLEGIKLLLVDDDADGRELMSELLRGQGAQIWSAATASDALAHLDRETPDLVLTDLAMPQKDGFALLRDIRRRGLKVKCAALTALARPEDRTRALEEGFLGYYVKPVDFDTFLDSVARLVERPAS